MILWTAGILLTVAVRNKQGKKGEVSPFPLNLFLENKILMFFSLLLFNLIVVNIVDFFDLSKNFSNPGGEIDLEKDLFFLIIFFGIVIPMFEEFIFRYWFLEKISKVIFPLILLILYIIFLNYHWIFNISFVVIYIIHVIYISKNRNKIFLISILNGGVFAFFHFVNFPIDELITGFTYLPILFLPQFVLGVIVCFIKTFGFRYAVFYHILYNSLLILIEYAFN
jgi:membrane protease YdiL (CAAX protease family)